MKKNREFIIGLIFLIAVAVMIAVWVDSKEKSTTYKTPLTNTERISAEEKIDGIAETSESTDLDILESEINLDLDLGELETL